MQSHLDRDYPGWLYYEVDFDFTPEVRTAPEADANDHDGNFIE